MESDSVFLLYNELEALMDFLLDPNVAYLILLAGLLLVMMAIVTPGTGLFEIGAFFGLAQAGYAVYNLTFNGWALVVLALSIVPFIYAIQKPKRELFLGLAILLLIVGSVFLFVRENGQPAVNPFLAVTASTLVAGFLWLAIRKTMQAMQTRPAHDLDGLVGQVGESRTDVHEDGSVQVAGELWSARSAEPISAGSHIRVVRREGFILVVEKNGSSKI
jgi:membrane-bound serine protease (ClpP class)